MSRNEEPIAKETEELLLGYWLDALEADERQSLEERLRGDAGLKETARRVRLAIAPLQADAELLVPPLGLAARTCAYVERQTQGASVHPEPARTGLRWRWADMLVAAVVLLAASIMFFPSVVRSRFDQQVAYCRENLRQVSLGLNQYSQLHAGFFPHVPARGNYAAAGVFGPTLLDQGLLAKPQSLICPTSPQAIEGTYQPVRLVQLQTARGPVLLRLHRAMGGSYGYALGYEKNGRYVANRNLGRERFALVADAPSPRGQGNMSLNHEGRGQNVLFEDGHVEFLTRCRPSATGDDYYHNELGIVGAGQHADDAVVAPSWARPVLRIEFIRFLIPVRIVPLEAAQGAPPLTIDPSSGDQ